MFRVGHAVRLIAPQYVRPFVKRQKNDTTDAEAIVVAAQRLEMRFVEPKTEEQQACAVSFGARERLLHQRTELVNALRSVLYVYGHVFPKGIGHIKRIEAVLEEPNSDLPALVREKHLALIRGSVLTAFSRLPKCRRQVAELTQISAGSHVRS